MMNRCRCSCRKLGAYWAISQGLLTALVPQLCVLMTKKVLAKNFENADALEAKPEYLRQLRALGVGLAVAGAVSLALETKNESGEEIDDGSDEAVETIDIDEESENSE